MEDFFPDKVTFKNDRTFSHTKLRYVHAARKRTLRKRGVPIHFAGYNEHGNPIYVWTMQRYEVVEHRS